MTPMKCLKIWRNAAPKLAFEIQGVEGEITLNSNEIMPELISPAVVEGRIGEVPFKLFVEQACIEAILAASGADLSLNNIEPLNAGIIIEHIFSGSLQQLENVLQKKITLISVTKTDVQPESKEFGFSVHLQGDVFVGIFEINNDDILKQIITELLPYQLPEEKKCSNKCDAIVGPIELSEQDFNKIQTGDLLTLGQEIKKEITGYIKRESGTCWRARIDPSVAIITSDRHRFVDIHRPSNGKVQVGIKIGTVDIKANEILDIRVDTELKIERFEGNSAHLMVDENHVATGNLQTIEGKFCLSIKKMEVADVGK